MLLIKTVQASIHPKDAFLYHYYLRNLVTFMFMFSKVNVLRQFLGFYCPYKLGLSLNHDAFLYHYYLGLHQACFTFSYICSCSVR